MYIYQLRINSPNSHDFNGDNDDNVIVVDGNDNKNNIKDNNNNNKSNNNNDNSISLFTSSLIIAIPHTSSVHHA